MDKAVAGEAWAAQMVADRLEGKPLQQSETEVEMDASELFLKILRRMQPPRPEPKAIEHATGRDHPAAEPAAPQ